MDKIKTGLIAVAILGVTLSFLGQALPVLGLSTMLGTIILISSIITTTLIITTTIVSTTIISSSVLSSSANQVIFGPYLSAYNAGVFIAQLLIAFASIAMLAYIELTNPSMSKKETKLLELRKLLLPFSIIAVSIFFIVFVIKAILAII